MKAASYRPLTVLVGIVSAVAPRAFAQPLQEVDLASDTAWTLRIDGGPPRAVRVPGGGWNSDLQNPPIDTMTGVKDHVVYERKIRIPKLADGQVTKVLFGAVNYGAEVFVDDKLVGHHAGPLTPFEIDLTRAVRPGGEHTLTAKAYHRRHYYTGNTCDVPVGFDFPAGSKDWCSWAGNTKFAYGITKHVKLAVFPAVHIRDVFVKPSVSKDRLEIMVWVENASTQGRTLTLKGELSSWNGDGWKYPAVPSKTFSVPAGKGKEIHLGPVPWGLGPESYWWPNIPFREDYVARLHNVKMEVTEGAAVLHRTTRRFGFCEHAEGPYYYTVNGVRVTNISDGTVESQMSDYDCYSTSPAFLPPKGPKTGCPETWRRYSRIGINTNRICCSIPTDYMMDAADEVGFMLMPEGVTWGNGLSRYHDVYTPQTVKEMARLCRNHPSVVRYSLTNEVGGPIGKDWPWRALIDAVLDEDDTRPLVYELVGCGVGRIDGVRRGHAHIDNHYGNIDKGGDFIRSMGEHFWETDGMAAFGLGAQQLRLYDWAYFAPWSWINYWPNFLEGMSRAKHAWKANNGPDREDGVNGWGSPIVRFVQRGLHPYLLVDHDLLRTNPPKKRMLGDGQIEWPYRIPRYVAGDAVERRVEVFNGGLSGNAMSLNWTARWDRPDGPVALEGATIGPFEVRPGFHVTQVIRLTAPAPGTDNRRLYLVMESRKDSVTLYREDRVFFNIAAARGAARPPTPGGTAKFLGSDDQLQGDWYRKYGAEGYELIGDVSKLPPYASVRFSEGAEARVVDATWRGDSEGSLWTWEAKTDDRRAFSRPSGKDRLAACWYGDTIVFDLDVGQSPRNVTMYFLDWDQQGVREQTVEIRAGGGEVFHRRKLTAFHHGKYLTWTVQGHVQVEIRKGRGNNAVISGIFFDKPEVP